MPDSIGNSLNDAQSIIIGTTAKRFSDSVEFGDQDYFRFTLARASSFSLVLSGLSANADVEILDNLGNSITEDTVLLRSTNEGTIPDTINTFLDAGTYYIHVIPGPPVDPNNAPGTTPSTNYNLDVRADNGVRNDIIWRYYGTGGATGFWRMDGTTFLSGVATDPVNDPAWVIAGGADFNDDGISDYLWRYYGTDPVSAGTNGFWFINESGSLASIGVTNPLLDRNWLIRGTGSFDNGAGKPEIFWQNAVTGQIAVWYLDSSLAVTSGVVLPGAFGTNGSVQALGDFNLDGNTDYVWRTNEGENFMVFSAGGFNFAAPIRISPELNLNKIMQGAGDFNGDGYADLLWRDLGTGENEVWLLEGASLTSVVPILGVADPLWRAVTPFTRTTPLQLTDLGSQANPFNIGALNGAGVYRDEITALDTDDYYRFTLGSPTRLSLTLDGLGTNALQGNLNLQILTAAGTPVAGSLTPGNANEAISNLDLNPGTYLIRVFAGDLGATSAYDLQLNVNNLPILVSRGPIAVNEGQSITLRSTALLVTDENDPPERLVYTLVAPPAVANGSLLSNGAALVANSTFTQADINAGRITYRHNGSEVPVDTFVFSATDGRGGLVANTTFTINVTPVNDPPVLISANPVLVTEGLLATISNTSLLVTDVEQTPTQLIYTVSSLPTTGTLSLLAGTFIGPLSLGSTFSQADVDAGRVGFRHNGSETTSDRFTFTAGDGAGGFINPLTQTIAISTTPVNDPPELVTNVPLTVSQAGPGFITSALLRATDAELLTPAQQDQIRYTVTSLPTTGTLFFNGVAQTAPFTFSQADLNVGNIVAYAQGGGASNSDRFTFRISDGTATVPTTGDFTYDIFIQRTTSPPILATPNPSITLDEGATSPISNTTLRVTDADSAAFLITYTLGATPAAGSVVRSGVTLTAGATFTQLDIDNNRLSYQHNGSEAPPTDAFTFTFNDESGTRSPVQTFSVTVRPINDPPILLNTNLQLAVTEGFTADLGSTFLNATDPDNLASGITYSVTNSPVTGEIRRSGTLVTTFTQADVNAGLIKFIHNGSESTSDSFVFVLRDAVGAIGTTATVNINITSFNDAPGLASLAPLLLSEGETLAISNSLLTVTDADGPGPITYTIGNLPANGLLKLGNVTLSAGGTFTQADIDSGQLSYVHSGSETTSDRFTFTATDGATTGLGAPGTIPLTTFTIGVTSVNDPPTLLNTNLQLAVTEGFSADLNNTLLNATDADSIPSGITYSVTSSPVTGEIRRSGTLVTEFTQADVNAGLIKFIHDGSESTADSFVFELEDALGAVGSTATVNLNITPFNDAPGFVGITPLTLQEGETLPIDNALLAVTDDDGPGPITYTIGALPLNGILRRGNVTLSAGGTFTQADVDGNQLTYVHNGSETTSDRFTFTASDGATTGLGAPGTIPLTTFTIAVQPVNDNPGISLNQSITLSEGGLAAINNTILRATDPDNLTSALQFNLLSGPTNGTLLSAGVQVFSFTQADINGNLISYRHNGSETTLDEFTFEVNDGNGGLSEVRTFSIGVLPVNDIPTLVANQGIAVDEGGTVTISNVELLATDVDGPSDTVIFTLGAAPTRGVLLRNGVTLSVGQTFTQSDIDNNRLQYVDNGRDPVANDRFTFTASDGSTGVLPLRTFSLTLNPVNDAPIITAPTSIAAVEDTTFTFGGTNVLTVADIDGGPDYGVQISTLSGGILNLGATSGLTNLGGNNSSSISFNSSLGNLNNAIRALRYRGSQDFNGEELIVITVDDLNANGSITQTITMNVAAVNDGPTLVPSTTTLNLLEDQTPPPTFSFTVNDIDLGDGELSVVLRASNGGITVNDAGGLSFASSGTNGSSVVIFTGSLLAVQNALGNVSYQSNPNYFGSDRITVSVNDQGSTGLPGTTPSVVTSTLSVNVASVNDAPTFAVTGSSVINVNEDSPQQVIPFVSGISTGAANEAQTLSFSIIPSSAADATLLPNLFTATPTISTTSGNLTFTPRANANGTVTLVAFLVDNGGTANGGQNTSAPFTFSIEVNQVNDAPSFTRATVPTVTEDAGAITINNWATNISVGPSTAAANESTQTPSFIFETSNPSLFAVPPQVVNLTGTTAALTFTAAPNANGIATVTVRLRDSGGTANGGIDTSPIQTFTINVLSVNDAPTFDVLQSEITVLEDDPQQSVQIASNIVVGPDNELTQTATFSIASNSNPNLFLSTNGGITPTINPQGFLSFKTANNAFGSAVIVARLVDNGGTTNGGVNQSAPFTFTINATSVNDAPSFTKGADLTISEDAPAQSILSWARNITPGPNESTQTVVFGVETDNPGLFATGGLPTIDPTGRLTYTAAANAFGTAIVTVSLVDNGGTANGGVDTSPLQTFRIVVNPVNDRPTLTLPSGTITTGEDQAIDFSGVLGIQFSDIDAGNNPIEVRLSVRNGTVSLPSTNGLSVTSGANGTSAVTFTGTLDDLRAAFSSVLYTPNAFFNGADGLTIVVNDRGSFGTGGALSVSNTIPITITAVNNSPVLFPPGSLTLGEGGNASISNTLLRTTDPDNTAAQLIYTLVDAPDSGVLRLSTGAASFTTIVLGGTFTQADINSGRLNYLHDGSETTNDTFTFRVSDGAITLPDTQFDISVIPVDDPPALVQNLGATVTEGEVVVVDGSRLSYVDPDNTSAELIYTLTSMPSGGTLRLGGTDLTIGSTFTQEQLDIGLLTFEQNGSEGTSDTFNFQVGDRTTSLLGSFNFTVIPVNDPPTFIPQGNLTVSEGGSTPVSSLILKTTDPDTPANQLTYTVTGGPGFGTLLRNNSTTIAVGQTFTQAEVDAGVISYRNNGSEVASDALFFTVSDGASSDSNILNISVTPVNDPPTIVRSTSLSLSAATPTTRVLNNSQLLATDVDNSNPADIQFVLTTLPNPAVGELLLNGSRMTVGQFFTQADINNGRVSYRYLGGGTSDGFQYSVRDVGGAPGGSRFFPIVFTA